MNKQNEKNTEKRYWIYDSNKIAIREIFVAPYSDYERRAASYDVVETVDENGKVCKEYRLVSAYNTCDLFESYDIAVQVAKRRVRNKIVSLSKKIAKLQKVLNDHA